MIKMIHTSDETQVFNYRKGKEHGIAMSFDHAIWPLHWYYVTTDPVHFETYVKEADLPFNKDGSIN